MMSHDNSKKQPKPGRKSSKKQRPPKKNKKPRSLKRISKVSQRQLRNSPMVQSSQSLSHNKEKVTNYKSTIQYVLTTLELS